MKRKIITQPGSPMAGLTSAIKRRLSLASILCCALAVVWAGCTTQQQQGRDSGSQRHWGSSQQQQQQPQEPAPAPEVAPAPAAKVGCSDPTWGLIKMTKTMPREATLGGEFAADLNITAQACAANVVVRDPIPANASYVRSEPAATVEGDQLIWRIGDMDAGQTVSAKIWYKATKEGTIVNCASVSADPRVCGVTRIVNPAIELTKSEPSDVLVCDPIPVTLVVKNTGSSQLTGVKVTDNLPEGLTSDGKSSLAFDAGNLAPGESKQVKFNATATSTGKYQNSAEVTTDQGVNAKASAPTAVHQPVLAITCKAADQQFMGRKFDVSYTVSNTGDAPAAGTKLEVAVPVGLEVASAGNGQVNGGKIDWDLGSVAVDAPKTVTATFNGATAGTFDFAGTAKADCAAQISTSCETKVIGVSAILLEKSDDPDPVAIGDTTTYTVKVTNQGSANDSNVHVIVTVDSELVPISSSEGTINGQVVDLPVVPTLAPKTAVTYKIVAKGVTAGGAVTKFSLTSDMLKSPITAEESTTVY